MRIEYSPAVAGELEEIRDFYESRSEGLGVDFVNEFEKQALRIIAMPERWMIVRWRKGRRTGRGFCDTWARDNGSGGA